MVTLAITPLRWLTGINQLINYRRLIGLFAFFYGSLHFLTYFFLDHQFDFAAMFEDVRLRPYITAGFTAFVLMIPLALTSTTGWIRRLGGKNWNLLHKLIYITAMRGGAALLLEGEHQAGAHQPEELRHPGGGPAGVPRLATLCAEGGF